MRVAGFRTGNSGRAMGAVPADARASSVRARAASAKIETKWFHHAHILYH